MLVQAYELLKGVFPEWSTLSTNPEPCVVCEAMVQLSREDKRGAKIQAEEEKVRSLLDSLLSAQPLNERRPSYDICMITRLQATTLSSKKFLAHSSPLLLSARGGNGCSTLPTGDPRALILHNSHANTGF